MSAHKLKVLSQVDQNLAKYHVDAFKKWKAEQKAPEVKSDGSNDNGTTDGHQATG